MNVRAFSRSFQGNRVYPQHVRGDLVQVANVQTQGGLEKTGVDYGPRVEVETIMMMMMMMVVVMMMMMMVVVMMMMKMMIMMMMMMMMMMTTTTTTTTTTTNENKVR